MLGPGGPPFFGPGGPPLLGPGGPPFFGPGGPPLLGPGGPPRDGPGGPPLLGPGGPLRAGASSTSASSSSSKTAPQCGQVLSFSDTRPSQTSHANISSWAPLTTSTSPSLERRRRILTCISCPFSAISVAMACWNASESASGPSRTRPSST